MDPLSALSVAGNIIQFIQFGLQVLSKGQEICGSSSGLLAEESEIGAVSQDVKTISRSIKLSLNIRQNEIVEDLVNKNIDVVSASQELEHLTKELKLSLNGQQSLCVNEDEQALNTICDSCVNIANELSEYLEKLKVKGQKYRRWKSFRQALKTVWRKEDIDNLVKRLSLLRGQLELHILASLRTGQSKASFVENKRFQALHASTQNIITFVLENRSSFEDELRRRTEVLEKSSASQHAVTRSVMMKEIQDTRDKILERDQSHSSLLEALLELKKNFRTIKEISHHVENLLLQSLKFAKMTERHEEISEAHRQTFDWILRRSQPNDKPWSNFAEWLRSGSGVYWVNGKAASGKSTLMRHIFDNPVTRETLIEWAQGLELQIVGFFFWSSGTAEQRSHAGILRSLLFQALSSQRKIIQSVLREQWDDLFSQCADCTTASNLSLSEFDITWSLSKLQQAFMRLTNELVSSKMCLFIDGLDEYDGDCDEMARFLIEISSSSSVKVCVSSRSWVVFEDAFKQFPTLRLQDLTYTDIVRYVDERLNNNERWVQLECKETKNAEALKHELVTMANGIFLWVKLVVRSLLSGLSNHDEILDLSRRLRLLPPGLEALFDHMLRAVDPFYREEASMIFQIVRTEREAQEQATIEVPDVAAILDLLTLSLADEKHSVAVFEDFEPTNEEILILCRRTEDRLKTRCAGLLELGTSSGGYWRQNVIYMHRTVRDFLEGPEMWAKLLRDTSSSGFHPAICLLQSSIMCLKIQLERSSSMPSREVWRLIQLAMIYGRMANAQLGNQLERLLDELDATASKLQNKYDPYGFHWSTERNLQGSNVDYESCSSFLSFAIEYGISSYVRSKVYQDPTVISRKRGRPLLHYAVCPNRTISNIPHRPELVNLLLDYGSSPNEVFKDITPWQSALSHLAMQHLQEIMETEENTENETAVTTIKLIDWVEIIALLIKHGAEPNVSVWLKNDLEIRQRLSAVNIIMHAFSRQFPIQASDIRRMLISRGSNHHATKRPTRHAKRQGHRSKPTGSHKKLGGHLDRPRLGNRGGTSEAAGEGSNDHIKLTISSVNDDGPNPPAGDGVDLRVPTPEFQGSCRPSFLLVFYLCTTTLLRAATARTYWHLDERGAVASLSISTLAVQLIMMAVESCSKIKLLVSGDATVSREETAGFLSRTLLIWLNSIMFSGYRRTLTALDLQPIDSRLGTSKLSNRFKGIIRGTSIGPVGPPGVTLRSPFLTSALIQYLGDDQHRSKSDGYGLTGATFLVYTGIAGKWLAATEKRINETKNMLASLKAIKMTGASKRVAATIEALRLSEFDASKLVPYGTLTLFPALVFGVYAAVVQAKSEYFDASRLFSSLILISLLASSLIKILQIIPAFGAARGCFARLEEYLVKPERRDRRLTFSGQTGSLIEGNASGIADLNKNAASEKVDDLAASADVPVLSIRNADFSWAEKVQLKNINLEVRKGEHIAITGPVGYGKTLLLQVILGKLELLSGTVCLGSTKIGYCSQTPWLQNLTALENVFRSLPSDETWRRKIIHACALDNVIKSQNPDQTISSGEAKLSNGERQRLRDQALARTIAFRPSIILLDNAFSAVDRTTETHIIKCLFGSDGILQQLGITVVQITQNGKLSVMRPNRMFKIDEAGQLILCESNEFVPRNEEESTNTNSETAPEKPLKMDNKEMKLAVNSSNTDTIHITDRAVYQTYFSAIGRTNMIIFFIWGCAFAFTLKFAVVPTSGVGLHGKLLTTTLNATFVFINNIDSGSLMNRFNQDLSLIDLRLPLEFFNTASGGLACIVKIGLVAVAAVYALITLPILFIVLYLVQNFYLRTSKQLPHLDLESKSDLHTKLSEISAGLVTIRAHSWQDTFRREFDEKLDRSQEPLYLLYAVQRWLQLIMNLIVAGLSVTVARAAVGMRDKTSGGAIGVALLNMTTLGETMTNLITSWTSIETSMAAIARIESFEKNTPVEAEVVSAVKVSPDWPASGNIRINNLWASYNPDVDISQDTFFDAAINTVLVECALLEKINASGGLSSKMNDANLSAGEEQLFAFARTILGAGSREGGIVLFDEATSSIDTVAEQKIMKLMADRLQGKTIISVLHRLEVALKYDRILVLDKGQMVHFGTPAEILKESELFSTLSAYSQPTVCFEAYSRTELAN
ncbi:hypothetical protein G7Y89_g4751 [Cudoniella acicularis]|uniref:Uncharacterized protein n=1 Tax=Cudoniella acicularis TaxID=354080 RepID=A0A8H4RPM0_9HELO|nr:hypothetical protein G7Y89_g4751 [Cudoniella acicularis]